MSDVPSSTFEVASIMVGLENDDEKRTNDFLNWSLFFTSMFPFCCGFFFTFMISFSSSNLGHICFTENLTILENIF